MKKTLFLILLLVVSFRQTSLAQNNWDKDCKKKPGQSLDCPCDSFSLKIALCDDSIECCIRSFTQTLRHELPKEDNTKASINIDGNTLYFYNNLVTASTYNRYFAKDMAKILTLDNAVNTGRNFAAVNIDEDKSTFIFSPLNKRFNKPGTAKKRSDGRYESTFGFVSTFLKGSVNSDGIAEIFKGGNLNKEFTIGGTFIFMLGGSDGFSDRPSSCCDAIQKKNFRNIQQALPDVLCKKYQDIINKVKAGDIDAYSDNKEIINDCESMQDAMRADFSDMEESLAESLWGNKRRFWLSLTPQYGFKGFSTLDTIKQNGTADQLFGAGSLSASINGFWQNRRWSGKPSFYLSGTYALTRRNQFTEVTTQTWNMTRTLKDSSTLVTDSKDVYLFDGRKIDNKFLSTLSAEAVGIWTWDHFGIGFDVSFSQDWLYTTPGTDQSRKFAESYGVVFPFNDKDGVRTVNVSLFYQHIHYSLASLDNTELFGIKFAVPLFSGSN